MLRIIQEFGGLPVSFRCDPSATFEAGTIGELVQLGNEIVVTVSNGDAPLGIIDDFKTNAMTNVSWNEIITVPIIGVPNGSGQLVAPLDVQATLKKANIVKQSFTSSVDAILNPVNGIIIFPSGTVLNSDVQGTGKPSGIRAIVNYSYFIPNIPGEDSTIGSGRVTIWMTRMLFQTTMFETNQQYPLRANLFTSECGLLTTRQPKANSPAIGMVMGPPSPTNTFLAALWY